MKLAARFASVAFLAVAAATAQAQVPNFAGTWTVIPDPNAAPGGGGGGGGGRGGAGPLTIAQDANTITVTRTTQAGETKTIYNLNGSASKNTMNFGGNAMEQTSTLKADGPKVTITTKFEGPNGPIETTQSWWIENGNLVIESTGMGRGGNGPTVTKRTYKKS